MGSNITEFIFGAIGLVLLLGVLFEAWRYLKGHPQALADLEAKVKAAEVKAEGISKDAVAAIHAKLDSISTKVDATHAAALAPVTVVGVPYQAPPMVPTGQPRSTGTTSQVPTGLSGPVTFDPSAYTDPASRLAALRALQATVPPMTPILDPQGNQVDVRGNSIVPQSAVAHSSIWTSFDGGPCYCDFAPGQVLKFRVEVGKPFVLRWYDVVGTTPCQMGATATDLDGNAAPFEASSGAGNGGEIRVNSAGGIVSLIAPVQTRWAVVPKE